MTENKKKILYLLEYPLDLPGGAQMSTQSLCASLMGSNYEPVVVCPHLLKPDSVFPYRVITYPMGKNRILNLIKRILYFEKTVKDEAPDIVHIQMPESLITYGFCSVGRKKKRPALIFTDRGLFYGYRAHSMFLMKRALRRADLLLVTTDYNKKMWEKGTDIRPIEKIANTISSAFTFYDDSIRKQKDEKKNGLLTLGLAGRICEEKDWPFAVKLIERMAGEGLEFRVDMVLSTFEEKDAEMVEMIKSTLTKVLGDRLTINMDFTQQQMQEYYYGVDIFLMTSVFESFGKAAVEAMSRKCAVLSTDVGGLSEVVGKEDNLYTKEDPSRAVEYVKKCITDRDFLKKEQEYFLNRYRDNFSIETCLTEHLKVYDNILSGH